jgi:hypothetical protein
MFLCVLSERYGRIASEAASLASTNTLAALAEAITKYIKVQKSAEQTSKNKAYHQIHV